MPKKTKLLLLLILLLSVACAAKAQDAVPSGPNDGEQHAIDQLRAVAEKIKNCEPLPPSVTSLGPEMDAEGFADVYGPPINVVWNVELHPSIRARYTGSIEFSEPSYFKLPSDDSYCNKPKINKSECKRLWLWGTQSFEYKKNHPLHFRYDFDVTNHGLEFFEAFTKTKQVDDEPWVDGGMDSDRCAITSIKSVLSGASRSQPPLGIPKEIWREAANGNADAQFLIGNIYSTGIGVPQDYTEAYFWLDLAASGKTEIMKSEDVAKLRDSIASHLTSAILLQTQERARKWSETHPFVQNGSD